MQRRLKHFEPADHLKGALIYILLMFNFSKCHSSLRNGYYAHCKILILVLSKKILVSGNRLLKISNKLLS